MYNRILFLETFTKFYRVHPSCCLHHHHHHRDSRLLPSMKTINLQWRIILHPRRTPKSWRSLMIVKMNNNSYLKFPWYLLPNHQDLWVSPRLCGSLHKTWQTKPKKSSQEAKENSNSNSSSHLLLPHQRIHPTQTANQPTRHESSSSQTRIENLERRRRRRPTTLPNRIPDKLLRNGEERRMWIVLTKRLLQYRSHRLLFLLLLLLLGNVENPTRRSNLLSSLIEF